MTTQRSSRTSIRSKKSSKRALSAIFLWFSKKCTDRKTDRKVCVKRIKDDKQFFDQSLQEIYILNYIAQNGKSNEDNFLQMMDCFYLNVS